MFVAITYYRSPDSKDIIHFINIASNIDYLLIRTPMPDKTTATFLDALIHAGFPKEKILIHSSIDLLEAFNLHAIHFREGDDEAFHYKHHHPEISVSMSAHFVHTIEMAQLNGLDFVLFGHIFESASKKNRPPRSKQEVSEALSFEIPVIALGGINARTIHELPKGFSGVAAISYFMDTDYLKLEQFRKEWERLNLM